MVTVTATSELNTHDTTTVKGEVKLDGGAGDTYFVDLTDPQGRTQSQHGTLGPDGSATFVFQVGRVQSGPGTYMAKATVSKGKTVSGRRRLRWVIVQPFDAIKKVLSVPVQRCSLRPGLSLGKTRFARKVPTMAMKANMIWSFRRVD